MSNESAFSRLHPLTLSLWFFFVLTVTVMTVNPILAALSLLFSALYKALTTGISIKGISVSLAFMLLIALLNPLFSHHGVTVLFFLNDLPVTLESLLFGGMMSLVVMSSVLWCGALALCMTSDKVIWLFGKPFPKLAVLISLTLRLLPAIKTLYGRMKDARTAAGLYDDSSPFALISSSLRIFSALVTMILEDSIDTADSMKARGLMLRGRTSCSIFRFRPADFAVLALVLLSAAAAAYSSVSKAVSFTFYPAVSYGSMGAVTALTYGSFALTAVVPSFMEVTLWKQLHSTTYRSNTPQARNSRSTV